MMESVNSAVVTKKLIEASGEDQPLSSMSAIDIITPPTQDSPKNILNILNNDCLQAIFRKVDNVRDFYSVAHVCVRFQQNAIECFPFGEIQIKCSYYFDSNFNKKQLIFFNTGNYDVDMKRFLELFGSRIKFIDCDFMSGFTLIKAVHDETLDLISLHCGKTLNKLRLRGRHGYAYEPRLPFETLEALSLICFELKNIDPVFIFPELKSISVFRSKNIDWLMSHFPKLEHVDLSYFKNSTNEKVIEFQNRHPQLKSVQFHSDNLTSSVWKDIEKRLPNIVKLSGWVGEFGENIVQLSKLQYLKKISLKCLDSDSLKPVKLLFTRFVENKQPIEELHIENIDVEFGKILQKLKTIRKLSIDYHYSDVSIDFIKNLPNLEYLTIDSLYNGVDDDICDTILPQLTEIFRNCKKLTVFNFYDIRIDDDVQHFYHEIVKLATGRVRVTLKFTSSVADDDEFDEFEEFEEDGYINYLRDEDEQKRIMSKVFDEPNEWVRVSVPWDPIEDVEDN